MCDEQKSGCCGSEMMGAEAQTGFVPEATDRIYKVEGLHCPNCALHVAEALKSVSGVSDALASLELAVVRVKASEAVKIDDLAAAAAMLDKTLLPA